MNCFFDINIVNRAFTKDINLSLDIVSFVLVQKISDLMFVVSHFG